MSVNAHSPGVPFILKGDEKTIRKLNEKPSKEKLAEEKKMAEAFLKHCDIKIGN